MMAGIDVARIADCPVCLGTFKDPRVLPCGHTFCLDCITKHGRSKGSDPDCPNCRTKFQIPSSDFDALPKNYSLNSVLYEKAKVTKGLCKKHDGEELVLYCVQCNVIICLDCLEDDHQKHDCSKISRFAKEAQEHLKGNLNSINCILVQVKTHISEVKEETKKFCDLLSIAQLSINEECDSIIQLVNKQRCLLLEELSSEEQKVTEDLYMKTDEINTELLRLASFITRIEDMLQGTDEVTTFDIVCQYKDFKECFDRLKQIQTQAMGQVSIAGIEFIPADLKDFISRSENVIGRLTRESDSIPKAESSRAFVRGRDPSNKKADHSISQRFPIDPLVWFYMACKHKQEVASINHQHSCIPQAVYEPPNHGIAQSAAVVHCFGNDSDEARKHVEDAREEFAQLYQEVAELGIVKEIIEVPFAFKQDMPQQLIAELEEIGVLFHRTCEGSCLIGPRACIQEAKQRVSDFISGHRDMSAQQQGNGLTQASPTDPSGSFVFRTRGGLTVHVSKGDLLRQSVDAIVSPADGYLSNEDGFARAVARAAGYTLQGECDEYIRKHGKLYVGHVMHTSAGNLQPRIKYVIHTVEPRKYGAKSDEELFRLVRLTVLKCLHYANRCQKVHSFAIPAIGSGLYGVPIEIVSRASFEALKMFDDQYACFTNKVLREIHFLNEDESIVSIMRGIFQSLMTYECFVEPEQVHATEALDPVC